jgi:hypothetical protein
MTSVLAVSAAVALLVAGCASSEDGVTDSPRERTGESQDRAGGGPGGPCATIPDGAYCGGDQVPGDPSTLYRCKSGVQSLIQVCAAGCSVQPAGVADFCK